MLYVSFRTVRFFAILTGLLFTIGLHAQKFQPDSIDNRMYRVNYWVSGSIAVTGFAMNTIGLRRLRDRPRITPEELNNLDRATTFGFDQIAYDVDLSKREKSRKASDAILRYSTLSPLVLFLDKDIRHQALDVTAIYLETQAIALSLYSWGPYGPQNIERFRPSTFIEALPLEDRTDPNNRNSLFSGHTSSTAAAAFFTAKVYCDFHPELGWKKGLIYGLAAIPTTMVGVYRVRALRHYPTDVIVGALNGALVGILVPELHKRSQAKFVFAPSYVPDFKGASLVWRF